MREERNGKKTRGEERDNGEKNIRKGEDAETTER